METNSTTVNAAKTIGKTVATEIASFEDMDFGMITITYYAREGETTGNVVADGLAIMGVPEADIKNEEFMDKFFEIWTCYKNHYNVYGTMWVGYEDFEDNLASIEETITL